MKRLLITTLFASLFLIAFSSHAQTSSHAQASSPPDTKYVEGQHYFKLDKPLKVSTGDKIEVRELFWYGCPHCYQLEPLVINWVKNKPDNAEFVATPAVFSQRWIFHAKAFYTIQALGLEEEAHPLIFNSIHAKRKPINNAKNLSKLLKANFDSDPETVEKTLTSFTVDSNVRAANAISVKSGANGVPTIIVDGKYRTSGQAAGSNVEIFNVVNFLVKKSQDER